MDNNPQNQPVQQPTQSSTPVSEPTPAFAPTPTPQPSKSSKKGLVACIIAGVVVLLAVAAALVYFLVFNVSKADYEKAQTDVSSMQTAYGKVGSGTLSGFLDGSTYDVDGALKKFDEVYNPVSDSYTTLSKDKAVKADKDVKAKFDDLSGKIGTFNEFKVTGREATEKIFPLIAKLQNFNSSDPDEALSLLKSVQTELHDMKLTQKANVAYVDALNPALDKMVNSIAGIRSGDSAASSDFQDATSELQTADTDWQSALTKLKTDADLTDQIQVLKDALSRKTA